VGESPWSNEVFAIDLEPPIFKNDVSSAKASTGDPFNLAIEVVDNVEVRSVYAEYWTDFMGPFNLSMLKGTQNKWNTNIVVPDNTGDLSYKFTAFDPTNNSISSSVFGIPIEDNDAPEISILECMDNLTTGDDFEIKLQVTDNIEVGQVYLEFWYGADELHLNVTMESVFNIYSYKDKAVNSLENFYWKISANDSSDNWITIYGISNVIDNDIPIIDGLEEDETVTTGDLFYISLETSDNVGIGEIILEYWFDQEEHIFENWGNKEITEMSISIPSTGYSKFSYLVHIKDTSWNTISTPQKMLEIIDDDPPVFDYRSPPGEVGTGEVLYLNGTVLDNLELNTLQMEYWINDDTRSVKEITPTEALCSFSFSLEIPMDRAGTLNILLKASDGSGNDNTTTIHEVSIIDVIKPTVEPISDITIYAGEILRIDAVIDDNIGIGSISWLGLPGDEDLSVYSSKIDDPGEYQVLLQVVDIGENSNSVLFNVIVLSIKHDSDNDGIPDLDEMLYEMDKDDPSDAQLDLDSDGMSNIQEYQRGTNLTDPDTDHDGMPDGWEADFRLDPLKHSADIDTDGDGMSDLEEYNKGSDPTVDETEEDGSILWIIILIIVIIFILLGAIGAFVILNFKNKEDPDSPKEDDKNEEDGKERKELKEPAPIHSPGPGAPSQETMDLINKLKGKYGGQNMQAGQTQNVPKSSAPMVQRENGKNSP
jgi:hypothetical protein